MNQDIVKLQEQIDMLKKQIEELSRNNNSLRQSRLYQYDFTPGCVKQRAMGEGNRFIRSGTVANLPTIGETVNKNSSAIYYETDTFKIDVYDLTSATWKKVTLA